MSGFLLEPLLRGGVLNKGVYIIEAHKVWGLGSGFRARSLRRDWHRSWCLRFRACGLRLQRFEGFRT